jgi:homoserine acetyltransferase
MPAQPHDFDLFQLGEWKLQSGESIPDAYIAYKAFGEPNLPAIVYPTWYSGGWIHESVLRVSLI